MSTLPTVSPHGPLAGRDRLARTLRHLFPPACLAVQALAVLAACAASWLIWRVLDIGTPSGIGLHLRLGLGAALLVVLLTILRDEHRLSFYISDENRPRHVASLWHMVFFLMLAAAFLTRRADELSRGAVLVFYVTGFAGLWGARSVTTRALRLASKLKLVAAQRLLVVGSPDAIDAFLRRHQPWNLGFEVVGSVPLTPISSGPGLGHDLRHAVEVARSLGPDDVFIAVPWSETETVDRCVDAFLNMPVAIHLAPERFFERFDQVAIGRIGAMASLELTRPMSPFATGMKRAFDIAFSALALLAFLPVLALVAAAIRLDSAGPVFFLQTRWGFNQRSFRIIKFRTMTTFADGDDVPQARRGDARVTRVGRWLRATNLDELPQLLNVLLGQMSLVGPRPHAVPHNRAFERRIASYARRHNVKPGITGWAQVNGLRGETDTEEKMRLRVEHDLFYIDNWSLLLDLRILLRTVFTRRAYRNAF